MAESFKMCYFFLYHLSAALCCKYAALFLVPLFLALAMYLCHFSNLQTPEYILPTPIKIVYEIPNACVCIDSYTFSNLTQVPICAFSFIFFIFLVSLLTNEFKHIWWASICYSYYQWCSHCILFVSGNFVQLAPDPLDLILPWYLNKMFHFHLMYIRS